MDPKAMRKLTASARARAWASRNASRIDKLSPRQAAELGYERAIIACNTSKTKR
jgi:serine protease inhibitor ecotin